MRAVVLKLACIRVDYDTRVVTLIGAQSPKQAQLINAMEIHCKDVGALAAFNVGEEYTMTLQGDLSAGCHAELKRGDGHSTMHREDFDNPGSDPKVCEHANENPWVCPCEASCY